LRSSNITGYRWTASNKSPRARAICDGYRIAHRAMV
jgi:hypothetical protein